MEETGFSFTRTYAKVMKVFGMEKDFPNILPNRNKSLPLSTRNRSTNRWVKERLYNYGKKGVYVLIF